MNYVIGDICGRYDQFSQLLDLMDIGDKGTLLFTGNYIGHPEGSVKVLSRIKEMSESSDTEVVAIKGDREEIMTRALQSPILEDSVRDERPYLYGLEDIDWWGIWKNMGGEEIAASLGQLSDVDFLELAAWVSELPYCWTGPVAEKEVLLCHAGIDPNEIPMSTQSIESLLWATDWQEDYFKNRANSPWDLVIHGHMSRDDAGVIRRGILPMYSSEALIGYRIEDGEKFVVK